MAGALRYRGHVYRLADGGWRGPDGHIVHFLTWVADDVLARAGAEAPPAGDRRDGWLAERVVARLGEGARLVGGGDEE